MVKPLAGKATSTVHRTHAVPVILAGLIMPAWASR